jgi:hypothetical protein
MHEPALTALKSQKQGQSNEPSTGIIWGRSLGERGARFYKSMGKVWNGFWVYSSRKMQVLQHLVERAI